MAAPYLLSSSTIAPVTPEVAFQGILDAPLAEIFPERGGLIPPIKETTGQDGAWSSVGQTRTVVLKDGSTNLETLVGVDRPTSYRYELTEFTGPFKALVASVDGEFAFVPEGGGTRITWNWRLHPTNAAARLLLPVVGASWRAYAAKMWPRFTARLTA